jgi:Zn-dependent protease
MINALLLLLLGSLKGAKLGTAGLSMLVSLALYARIWGWRYAAGVIASIFIHEMGHVIAARQRGLPVSAPAFIPFMGAFVTLRVAPQE